jgi:hypothetical protein
MDLTPTFRHSATVGSYRSIIEWKRMLVELEVQRAGRKRPQRIVEMIEGWLAYLEQKETSMPVSRRWECESHLNLLFRRLSRG